MFSWLSKKPVRKLKQGRKRVINDELWTFVDNYIPGHDGDCDKDEKTIRIQEGLPEERRLVVTIHEVLHGFMWSLSEEAVERFAEELAEILVLEKLTGEDSKPQK
jgi:hypothetical protein